MVTIQWSYVEDRPSNEEPESVDSQDAEGDSSSPTSSPSLRPTTAAPTRSPTVSPSTGPTASPSTGPTVSPSTGPTVSPSTGPTASPTEIPTTFPTNAASATTSDEGMYERQGGVLPSTTSPSVSAEENSERGFASQAQSNGDTEGEGSEGGGSDSWSPFRSAYIYGGAAIGFFVLIVLAVCLMKRKRRGRSLSSFDERGIKDVAAAELSSKENPAVDGFENDIEVESIDEESSSDDSSMESEESTGEGEKSVMSAATEIVWSFSNIERQGSIQPTENKTDDICM